MTRIGMVVAACTVALFACSKGSEPTSNAVASAAPAAPRAPTPSAALTPPGPFEGEIVLNVSDEGPTKMPTSITFDIKGDKVRYVPTAAKIRAVSDIAAQHAYAINDTQKAYADFDGTPSADKAKAPPPPKVDKSARSEKVAGLNCEDWSVDDGNEKVDVCVAKGIAFFDLASNPKPGSTEPAWAAALTKEKAFPLRVVVHDKAGKEQYRAEAFRIDRRKMDDALFEVPTGFTKGDLSADVKTASLP